MRFARGRCEELIGGGTDASLAVALAEGAGCRRGAALARRHDRDAVLGGHQDVERDDPVAEGAAGADAPRHLRLHLLDRYDTDESVVLGRGAWGNCARALEDERRGRRGEDDVGRRHVRERGRQRAARGRDPAQLQHPNIVRVLEMFDDTWDGELHVDGAVLQSLVGRLQEENKDGRASSSGERGYDGAVASLFRQLLRAVWYCHSNGVVHRDIKLSNLTYSTAALPGAELRLIDFGLAKQYDGTDALRARRHAGVPRARAARPPPLAYDSKVDLGRAGSPTSCSAAPCSKPRRLGARARRRIREELFARGAAWADVSEAATDLRKLLRKEADHRPPASAALEHAWLAEEAPTGQKLPRSVLRLLLAFSQASELKKLAFEAAAASAPQECSRRSTGSGRARRRLGSLSYDRWQAHVAAHHPELTPRLAERLFAQMAGGGQGHIPRVRRRGDHVPRAVAHAPRRSRSSTPTATAREREGCREAGAAAGEPPQRQPPQRRRRRR